MSTFHGIAGLGRSVLFDPQQGRDCKKGQSCPVVTISRDVGASGGNIARLLATKLSVPCYGFSMIDDIIEQIKSEKHLMALVDERYPSTMESWFSDLFLKGSIPTAEYYRRIIQTVNAIADTGGVILGRGAHLILASNPSVFRARIEGSLAHCAKRVSIREKVTIENAKEMIALKTKERSEFLRELYKRFPNNMKYSDIVINTDKVSDDDAVDILVYAMGKMGHDV
ncbi:MAG: cytidylate kinase-like family protein [Magnetococcales bacterium]|nr:cytidylate kinase-like family protein [Magnetococcales bacterium]